MATQLRAIFASVQDFLGCDNSESRANPGPGALIEGTASAPAICLPLPLWQRSDKNPIPRSLLGFSGSMVVMERFFNTEGPCQRDDHYMLPAEQRLGDDVARLIGRKQYLVIHAPRQVGKTTAFRALARRLTSEGRYAALLTSCEVGQSFHGDVEQIVNAVIGALRLCAEDDLPEELRPPALDSSVPVRTRLWDLLRRWAQQSPRPLVLFLDEIDALCDEALVTVLSQVHAGFGYRPESFPQSVALIGLRDVRDYRLLARADGNGAGHFGSASPFNIKARSLKLRNFTASEVAEFYEQHTDATGQVWTDAAKARAFELTCGQPWLVNALADQVVGWDITDRSVLLDVEHIESARETMIARRDTHLDSLISRLREKRVRAVVEMVLAGQVLAPEVIDDDLQFVEDLGLVCDSQQGLVIANPIYREIVPRALTVSLERSMGLPRTSYTDGEGRLMFDQLIDDFCNFWRLNAEEYLGRTPYSEAAAQLVFMAFLHKITNGHGHGAVDREYAAGRGRLDICVRWPAPEGGFDRWAVELKVWRDTTSGDPVAQGKDQLAEYLARLGLDSGILMVFDSRSDALPLPGRVRREEVIHKDRRIAVQML